LIELAYVTAESTRQHVNSTATLRLIGYVAATASLNVDDLKS